MKLGVCVALVALCLSGCVTAEQRDLALAAKDDGDCRSYGAQPGSQAYFQCRMTKDQARQQRRSVAEVAVLSRAPPPQGVVVYPGGRYYNTSSGLGDALQQAGDLAAARIAE